MTENVVERVLSSAAEIFRRPVDRSDSFFDLGGDSLTALELSMSIEAWLGAEVDLGALVNADSLEAFARSLPPGAA